MITKVCKKDYERIISSFTKEEIEQKYGKLEISEKPKKEVENSYARKQT
jgi:hypothetical protein